MWNLAQRITESMMKHPCIAGFCFGLGSVFFWWSFSSGVFASRSFPARQMQIFPFGSRVNDIYNGSLETLGKALQNNNLRFVAYYAPWCAQSRKMVPQMGHAAEILRDTYDFIAINCWVGSCKQNFSLREFPKFFAYHTKYAPVEFLEPAETWRIVRFLQSVTRPFHYIGNKQNLENLISSNEAIIFGYFNVGDQVSKKFSVFLELCISSANRVSKTLFGIVTNSKMASLIGLQNYGQVILHQILGKRRYFPNNLNFTAEAIFNWISKHHTEFVKQLTPNMSHLDFYVNELKKGPALMLFLSRKPNTIQYSLELLKQYRGIAARYHNCTSLLMATQQELHGRIPNELNREISHKDSSSMCVSLRRTSKDHCDVCQHSSKKQGDNQSFTRGEMYQFHQNLIGTNSCSCFPRNCYDNCSYLSLCCVQLENNEKFFLKDFLQEMKIRSDRVGNNTNEILKNAFDSLVGAVKNMIDATADGGADISSSLLANTNFKSRLLDSRTENSNKIGQIELKKLRTSYESNWVKRGEKNIFKNVIGKNFTAADFDGLRCKTNRTVNFFYLDIEIHKTMVRNLGFNREHIKKMTTLALVDVKSEATYIMHKNVPITKESIVTFVTNHTNGRLERWLRSAKPSRQCPEDEDATCIIEVTTGSFQEVVLDISKDVLIMYYAPWCGYCKQAYKVLLQLARFHKNVHTLRFARINADENDLPYHYTVDGYPTFLFFPMGRKENSRPYPDDALIRFEEMSEFIRSHSSLKTRTAIEKYCKENT